MTQPTFRLREDAIVHSLEEDLRTHGEDVVVAALAEFLSRGRGAIMRRVTATVGAQSRERARKRKTKSARPAPMPAPAVEQDQVTAP